MSFAEKQARLTRQLAALPDGQERLVWLMERARQQPPFPAAAREQNLVPGCLARLWLVAEARDGCCHFACDSDSLVVKAIAGLLCELYSGETPVEILAHDPQFLAPLGITQHLTPNRRNALAKVWDHIRQFAAKAGQASRLTLAGTKVFNKPKREINPHARAPRSSGQAQRLPYS